jgi:hypothetical protein
MPNNEGAGLCRLAGRRGADRQGANYARGAGAMPISRAGYAAERQGTGCAERQGSRLCRSRQGQAMIEAADRQGSRLAERQGAGAMPSGRGTGPMPIGRVQATPSAGSRAYADRRERAMPSGTNGMRRSAGVRKLYQTAGDELCSIGGAGYLERQEAGKYRSAGEQSYAERQRTGDYADRQGASLCRAAGAGLYQVAGQAYAERQGQAMPGGGGSRGYADRPGQAADRQGSRLCRSAGVGRAAGVEGYTEQLGIRMPSGEG